MNEIETLKAEVEKYRRLAFHDTLTGCLNRTALLHEPPTQKFVYMIDLDGLKEVNDNFGHEAGDDFICSAACALAEHGLVYRLGGDEFALFSEERIDDEISRIGGFSFGVASVRGDISSALKAADERMYENKMERKSKGAKIR